MERLTGEGGFDWVYLIVSPQNPFKSAENNLTARDRYKAAVEAVRRHPELRVWVDDIELGMEPPHYTIRTLDALREREPECDFTLIIGADNLVRFGNWKNHERILLEYGVAVFPREGFDMDFYIGKLKEENPDYRIRTVEAPLVTISSTEIRDGLAAGRDMSDWLM